MAAKVNPSGLISPKWPAVLGVGICGRQLGGLPYQVGGGQGQLGGFSGQVGGKLFLRAE